jgi:hypothetical protein
MIFVRRREGALNLVVWLGCALVLAGAHEVLGLGWALILGGLLLAVGALGALERLRRTTRRRE